MRFVSAKIKHGKYGQTIDCYNIILLEHIYWEKLNPISIISSHTFGDLNKHIEKKTQDVLVLSIWKDLFVVFFQPISCCQSRSHPSTPFRFDLKEDSHIELAETT